MLLQDVVQHLAGRGQLDDELLAGRRRAGSYTAHLLGAVRVVLTGVVHGHLRRGGHVRSACRRQGGRIARREVEAAQRAIVAIARGLAEAGEIVIGSGNGEFV